MNYVPTTEEDKKIMLERIGVQSINDLVSAFRPALSNGSLESASPID